MILECPSEMGSYDNKIFLKFPDFMMREHGGYYSSKNGCLVDICIVEEIKYLWSKGISTYGSCCGHSIANPMVNIDEKDFGKMEELGYKRLDNDCNNCTFALKSVHQETHKIESINDNHIYLERKMKHMNPSKEDIIKGLIDLLQNEHVHISQVGIENDSDNILTESRGMKTALTGYSTIRIEVLNRKMHEEFNKEACW